MIDYLTPAAVGMLVGLLVTSSVEVEEDLWTLYNQLQ